LEEIIEEDKALKNMNCGKLSKREKTPTDAFEHLAEKKDRLEKP
jgi:hypothetical protein